MLDFQLSVNFFLTIISDITIFQDLMNEGHPASQLILQLHDKLVQLDELDDKQKSVVMEKLAVHIDLFCELSQSEPHSQSVGELFKKVFNFENPGY